ncbi:stress response protein NST1 [Mycena rebaudengoi]|nr:stress response protein NST1 [Mycena rebaudengoi]
MPKVTPCSIEEKEQIRDFWLALREEERKDLMRVERETVLRKMKKEQKHSCSCAVCGKKSTAIEDELEIRYNAYYEDLEQYALCQQQ